MAVGLHQKFVPEVRDLIRSLQQKTVNPERRSSGSQFHLLLEDAPHMDGNYTIFGRVVAGLDTLKQLRRGDRIEKLTVFIREGGR